MVFRAVQFWNAPKLINSTLFPIVTVSSLGQSSNICISVEFRPSPRVALCRPAHPRKQPTPAERTVSGIEMLVSLSHDAKAPVHIMRKAGGQVMVERLVQLKNAYGPIASSDAGSVIFFKPELSKACSPITNSESGILTSPTSEH
jgi:hypothetical protein